MFSSAKLFVERRTDFYLTFLGRNVDLGFYVSKGLTRNLAIADRSC